MSSNRSDRRGFRALTRRERVRAVGTAVVLPVAHVLLRTVGYRRTVRLGERLSRRRPVPVDAAERAATTTRIMWKVNERLHLPTTCLSRCLALWYLLRLQGVPTVIHLGVRADGAPLDAHAWLEHAGRVLTDADDVASDYAVLRPDQRP